MALSNTNVDARRNAASALINKNPTDPQTLHMLVGLLNDPDPTIRREISELIKQLYPTYNGMDKLHADHLHNYVNSSCENPIGEVLSHENLDGIMKVLKKSAEGK